MLNFILSIYKYYPIHSSQQTYDMSNFIILLLEIRKLRETKLKSLPKFAVRIEPEILSTPKKISLQCPEISSLQPLLR